MNNLPTLAQALAATQWIGAAFGLLGAFLLATNTKASRYGWTAFLMSNLALITFTAASGLRALLLMQLGFTATSVLGLYRAGMLPFTSSKTAPTPSEVSR